MTIIWWLLGLVGVSGAGIGIAVLLGGGPAILGIALKLLGFAKSLSPKTWFIIGGAVALVIGFFWHQSNAHSQLKAADIGGYNRRANEDHKIIVAMRARAQAAEANFNRVTQEVRNRHDQEVSANAAAATAIFVRGPGAASCRPVRDPAIPARSGGNGTGHGKADAAVAQVPSGEGVDLFGLPVDGAVAFGQQNDDLIAEVRAWHDWYPLMVVEWNKLRQPLAKPAK